MTATITPQQAARATTSSPRRIRGIAVAAAAVATGTIYVAARTLGTDFRLTDPGKAEAHQLIGDRRLHPRLRSTPGTWDETNWSPASAVRAASPSAATPRSPP